MRMWIGLALTGLIVASAGCTDGGNPQGLIDNNQDYWSAWSGDPIRPAVLFLHAPASTLVSPGASEFTFSAYWPHYGDFLKHDATMTVNFQPTFECYDARCPEYGSGLEIRKAEENQFSVSDELAPGSWVLHVSFHGEHGNGAFHVPVEVTCPKDAECPPLRDSCGFDAGQACADRAWTAFAEANQ